MFAFMKIFFFQNKDTISDNHDNFVQSITPKLIHSKVIVDIIIIKLPFNLRPLNLLIFLLVGLVEILIFLTIFFIKIALRSPLILTFFIPFKIIWIILKLLMLTPIIFVKFLLNPNHILKPSNSLVGRRL